MKTFLDPNKINILCDNYGTNSTNKNENSSGTHERAESKQSAWTKFTSKVKGLWTKVEPIISGVTKLIVTVTGLLKAINKFGTLCKNMKKVFV